MKSSAAADSPQTIPPPRESWRGDTRFTVEDNVLGNYIDPEWDGNIPLNLSSCIHAIFKWSEICLTRWEKDPSKPPLIVALTASLREAMDSMTYMSQSWRSYIRSLYWMNLHHLATAHEDHRHIGVRVQRCLTDALVGVGVTERRQMFEVPPKKLDLWGSSWAHHYYGAISVAKTARALEEMSIRPILPTNAIDQHSKIDLFGELPGEDRTLLFLQIKTGKGQVPTWIDSLHEDTYAQRPEMRDPQYLDMRAHIRDRMQKFARQYQLNAHAAIIHVATYQQAPPWTYAMGKQSLLDALQSVVAGV